MNWLKMIFQQSFLPFLFIQNNSYQILIYYNNIVSGRQIMNLQRKSVKFQEDNLRKDEDWEDVDFEKCLRGLMHKKKPSIESLHKTIKEIKSQLKAFNQQSRKIESEELTDAQQEYTLNFLSPKHKNNCKSSNISPRNPTVNRSNHKMASIKLMSVSGTNSIEVGKPSISSIPSEVPKKTHKKIQKNFNLRMNATTHQSLKPQQDSFKNIPNNTSYNLRLPLSSSLVSKQYTVYPLPPTSKKKSGGKEKENKRSCLKGREVLLSKFKMIKEQCSGLSSKRTSIKDRIKRFAKYNDHVESQLTKKKIRIQKANFL